MAAQAKRGKAPNRPSSPEARKGGKVLRHRSSFFCKEKIAEVDYKNIAQLRRFVSERGRIKGRGITGACRKHQNR